MAKVYKKLEIDVNREVTSIITAVQNDANSRYLDVALLDGSTAINLTGHEVRIYCRKPENGGEVYNNGEITNAVNGRCQFPLTDQTLAKAGYLDVQLIIYKGGAEVLRTLPFVIHVVRNIDLKNGIESTNEYGALVLLYQNIYEFLNSIGETGDTGGTETTGSLMAKSNATLGKLGQVERDIGVILASGKNTRGRKFEKQSRVNALAPDAFWTFSGKKNVVEIIFYNTTANVVNMSSSVEITVDGMTTSHNITSGLNKLLATTAHALCVNLDRIHYNSNVVPDLSYTAVSDSLPIETLLTSPYSFQCQEGFKIKLPVGFGGVIYCIAIYEE
ncbi:BppU family phage baseplate upper protein [Anaerotignum propionicum]|uniref:BppU family phage baseplate upper protein n=1 Tax=Anaerotignum propionicum TaxID=28446 RepID=UPI00210EB37A|nr:BppU family phage baseplate upper protein [Anaerotignum propionicum]MCQ4936773.1 phage baseplate upper protein [Anaerotignum propionicum]